MMQQALAKTRIGLPALSGYLGSGESAVRLGVRLTRLQLPEKVINNYQKIRGSFTFVRLKTDRTAAKKELGHRDSTMNWILTFWRDEEGQSMVEHAILYGFVAVSVIGLMMGAGQDVKQVWTVANNQLKIANAQMPS